MNNKNFALGLLVVEALFLVGFVVFSRLNYKNRFKESYDLRNHFPYELNFEGRYGENLFGNICATIMSVCSVLFYVFFEPNFGDGYYLFTRIAGILYSISISFMIFVPMKMLKTHLLYTVIVIVFSFLSSFSIALNAMNTFTRTHYNLLLIPLIFSVVICLFIMGLIINPRINKWAKLEEVIEKDGAKTYKRPKWFVLAFTEWCLIFLSILIQAVVLINKFIY